MVDRPASARSEPPGLVLVGTQVVSVADTGDGSAARRFVQMLCDAGAKPTEPRHHPPAALRIVVRVPVPSVEARTRAEVLEEGADVILGSPRPVLAALLVSACAPWATS